MERRQFIRICAGSCTAVSLGLGESALAAADAKPRHYSRAMLVDESGKPLRASALQPGENYVFHYPFEGTPCFLLNLGRPTVRDVTLKTGSGEAYRWPGGVGKQRAIVAYSAICSHQLTHPTRQISFISYREQSTASAISRPRMIHCCSEHSEFDPAAGAKVMGGPAPQPLCAILLEHREADDSLHATGTMGGEMFDTFFRKFEMRLSLEHGGNLARNTTGDTTRVSRLSAYCKQQVRC